MRGTQRILVEVKSFLGRSFVADLQAAIGQYEMYQAVIDTQKLDFRLYMALASTVYEERFQSPLAQLMIQRGQVNLMVFDPNQEVVTQWIEISSIDR
jgi:hypothetical protein